MKLFKRTLTTAVAVCLALQSAVVCFGAEAEEQIPAGGGKSVFIRRKTMKPFS